MKKIRIFLVGIYLIIFFLTRPPQSHAQIESTSSNQIQKVIQEIMVLMLKKDICTLINHLEVPSVPKREWRSFFSSPSRELTQMRVQRDELLRNYINCIKGYILIFSRLSVTERSKMTYNIIHTDFQNHFVCKVEIETLASSLAETYAPDMAHKNIIITFNVNFKYSEKGWKIINIYNFSVHPN